MTDFGKFLHGARRAGRSIILSAEMFDNPRMDIPSLADALRGFETEVVVLHRPEEGGDMVVLQDGPVVVHERKAGV